LPLDGRSARERIPAFGFTVRSKLDIDGATRPRYFPLVDIRFNERTDVRLLGLKLDEELAAPAYRDEPWMQFAIVAGVVAAVVISAATEKKSGRYEKKQHCEEPEFPWNLVFPPECTEQ
jgi:hypothetical protein